ncbi:hypothetical protein [Bradyrhizobium sp. BR 10261]|uniref:hypothetical protein n=1 Tax=Bradyrhizobium sp. BR 10261 TaxID=2749992 RepID=UPI001C65451C|nr:hypothetical protein [Bradyrhizobium sp. BR 10261]MBW7961933.1 hypothetical protein [Bradyrhizobium sp. BR 10261]
MRQNGIRSIAAGVVAALFLAGAISPAPGASAAIDHSTSVRGDEKCSPCVLILFLYDLNKQWHVIRAATYSTLEACKTEGGRVNKDMEREIDKKTQPTTSFYCLREDPTK